MICTDSPADMDRLAAQCIAMGGGHTAELILAARRGQVALTMVAVPGTAAPMKFLRRATLPAIAVISDDPGDAGLGPSAWLATRRLVEWGAFAIVHAAAGTVADYRDFVTLAALHRRLLLIECSTARADEWAAVLVRRKPRPLPFMGIIPRTGAHPIAEQDRM